MKIYLGTDHRGFESKQRILSFLQQRGHEVIDLGAHEYDPDDDYNDYAIKVAKSVLSDSGSWGVLYCGSADGVVIQANRFKGIRAVDPHTPELAARARTHNDANVLCLASEFISDETTEQIVDAFLNTDFAGEPRYIRRNQKLDEDY